MGLPANGAGLGLQVGLCAGDHHKSDSWCHPWWDLIAGQLGEREIKGRGPRQVPGEGLFLEEKANLEFLDLIRKQLGSVWGGVAWGGQPLGQGPALQKAWRGTGESDLAKTANSRRPTLSGPEPKRHLPSCSEISSKTLPCPGLCPLVLPCMSGAFIFWETEQASSLLQNPAYSNFSEGLCVWSNQGPIFSPPHERTSTQNWSVTLATWASLPAWSSPRYQPSSMRTSSPGSQFREEHFSSPTLHQLPLFRT